ncbi:MAG: sulfatase-like hydrolase/transferase [Gemmatimonadetes bacterium]|jgi:arylsulfatase|nr:sulfatase-like hydrolase/transferase [Gemmatimonadota bacterium]MBT7862473.1 sulfatase-like hydrolase/transferase [Gemmatimonadota bacterium]
MPGDRPNLLFIMPDQLRPDFLSCYGASFIDTPHIDSLCDGGVRYDRACAPSPVCVPMRATLLTGLNAIRTGVMGNGQYLRPDLDACGIQRWPQLLSDGGYHTCAIGKMHFYPWEASMGFDHRIVCEDKRWIHLEDDYQQYLKAKGLRKLHGDEHEGYQENRGAIVHQHSYEDSWDGFVGNETSRYIREYEGDAPFAIMVGFPGPHCPYDPSPEYADSYSPDDMPDPYPVGEDQPAGFVEGNVHGNLGSWNGVDYSEFTMAHKKKIRAHYAALVKQIDDKVGQIIAALKDTGQYDNTIVVFCSDHGDYLGDHGLIGKGQYYESSTKVPLIVRLPGRETSRVHSGPISIEDITATLLHFAGCQIPGYMDSQPLPDLGIEGSQAREVIYGFVASGAMCYDGTWKLARYTNGYGALFNIEEDPAEQRNRIHDPTCQEIRTRLDALLNAQMLVSIYRAHQEKDHDTDWEDPVFAAGDGGWQRVYPQPMA